MALIKPDEVKKDDVLKNKLDALIEYINAQVNVKKIGGDPFSSPFEK